MPDLRHWPYAGGDADGRVIMFMLKSNRSGLRPGADQGAARPEMPQTGQNERS
jgi:hypothetical protein